MTSEQIWMVILIVYVVAMGAGYVGYRVGRNAGLRRGRVEGYIAMEAELKPRINQLVGSYQELKSRIESDVVIVDQMALESAISSVITTMMKAGR